METNIESLNEKYKVPFDPDEENRIQGILFKKRIETALEESEKEVCKTTGKPLYSFRTRHEIIASIRKAASVFTDSAFAEAIANERKLFRMKKEELKRRFFEVKNIAKGNSSSIIS